MNKQPRHRDPDLAIMLAMLFAFGQMLTGCNAPPSDPVPVVPALHQSLEATNQALLEVEKQEIIDFIGRYGWDAEETGSGLWHYIYREGEGPPARTGQWAVIHYSIRLLTGDLVYESGENEPKTFRIGRGGVESGLEEGILLMRVGDRAKFVLPAHLAHGVPGDGHRIPKRAAIVYDVELIGLEDN
jgi:FKBP-type peptidyl-prolyl cis-trans isomerase FkpA